MGSVLSSYSYQESGKQPVKNMPEDTDDEDFHDAITEMELQKQLNVDENPNHELQTDAVESKHAYFFQNPSGYKISPETVKDIEHELTLAEKISLVFLLYEQEQTALQFLLIEIENYNSNETINLISKWAQSKHTIRSWENHFLEALCVIQHYQILKRFGYSKSEMKERFLPHQPLTQLFINVMRKALFCICDNFTKEQNRTFINHLRTDFTQKSLNFLEFDEDFLELYFLNCFAEKYISNSNLTNIILILKKMGLDSKADILESIMNMNAPVTSTASNVNKKTLQSVDDANQFNCKTSQFDLNSEVTNVAPSKFIQTCSQNSVIGDNSIVKTYPHVDRYFIDPKNVGICLIINQKTFHRDQDPELKVHMPIDHDLKRRDGTDVDKQKLIETFSALGFRITVLENRTHTQLKDGIRETMKKFSQKDSCLVVCILSHGIKDAVYGANSVPVDINDIEVILHDRQYRSVLGKPKILIIQSCQGEPLQGVVCKNLRDTNNVTDGLTPSNQKTNDSYNVIDSDQGIPEKCDLLVCWSTVSGYASIRNETTGSWYIQELCSRIDAECERNHFLDILLSVNGNVRQKIWIKDNKMVCMVPEYKTTLGKKLFLFKVQPNSDIN